VPASSRYRQASGDPPMSSSSSSKAGPTGTVALVFTDIQGSTRLWERRSAAMRAAIEVHDRLLRALLASTSGYEVKTIGDAFMVAFPSAVDAARWCLEAQEALLHAPWPEEILQESDAAEEHGPRGLVHRGLRIRMGIHVGEPECRTDDRTGRTDYFGRMVNLAARVGDAGHGGQVLLSGAAWAQVSPRLEALGAPAPRALGEFRVKGIEEPVTLVELLPASLAHRRFPRLRVPEERRGNAPASPGDIIGRKEELETLRQWLSEGARLITLLGPGGMGKTRLAMHFVSLQHATRRWEGGVWQCSLTEAVSGEDICHAVSHAMGIPLSRDAGEEASQEQIGRALAGSGATLVLLDNLEHLLPHLPATLGRWLALAPQTRFLATSQEALRLSEERRLELAPLELPSREEIDSGVIASSEAVRLFVERARTAWPGFELTAAEAPLVAEIVRRLDGIPLAIELAAVRTSVLGVSQIRERLSRRFELLRGGKRDASARQATLRSTIDWSWSLLTPTEQTALAQCSIFRGGFTVEAAEAVLLLPETGADVLEAVESLRTKSLLRARAPEGAARELRLDMYESIREYAVGRLAEAGDGEALAARHADCYLSMARGLLGRKREGGGMQALQRVTLERENLMAACDNTLAAASATPEGLARVLEGLVALEPEGLARGSLGFILNRLERALERADSLPVPSLPWAEALAVRGRLYIEAGRLATARQDLERARASFLLLGATAQEKRSLVDLSLVALKEGNPAAWSLIQEAQALPVEGDRWLTAYTLGHLAAILERRSGYRAAIPHYREALELFRAEGDEAWEVRIINNIAVALGETGETREALSLLEEASDKAARLEERVMWGIIQSNLGCYLLEEGLEVEACGLLETALRASRQLGLLYLTGGILGELGRAYMVAGKMKAAQACLEQAEPSVRATFQWHALRIAIHLAATLAELGQVAAARERFAALEATPTLQSDATLRELTALLRASLDLAEARALPAGSAEARQALEQARRRLEQARKVPPEGTSSDLRVMLRTIEHRLRAHA
jgi:predicted ATPase/class 3 adenylate cyclase